MTPLDLAVASQVRMAMASRTPKMLQRDLEAKTGIPQSTLSRLLTPEKGMTLTQLEAICGALDLDTAATLAAAKADVRAAEASTPQPSALALGGTNAAPSRVHGQSARKRGGRPR